MQENVTACLLGLALCKHVTAQRVGCVSGITAAPRPASNRPLVRRTIFDDWMPCSGVCRLRLRELHVLVTPRMDLKWCVCAVTVGVRSTHANDMSFARCRCGGRSSVAVTSVKCCPSLLLLLVNRCVCCGRHLSETGRLHVPIVGPNGRSNPGYVRQSVRQVWQTVWTDCSRNARICQSNQCGLLANCNTADAAAWLVVRLASLSDQSDVVSTQIGRASCRERV